MNYLIVDDNKLAIMALKQIAANIEGIHLIQECESAMEAYNVIEKNSIDFVLLDIEMPEMTGLEFAKSLSHRDIYVIFTTGKQEYAIDAFDTNVVDYLLKPIQVNRLISAIDKIKDLHRAKSIGKGIDNEFFFIKDRSSLVKLMMKNVMSFDAMGDYVSIHTTEKTYHIHCTLKSIEERLNTNEFIRVHRSHIVAWRHIDKIEEGLIHLQNHTVSMADTYKGILNEKLKLF